MIVLENTKKDLRVLVRDRTGKTDPSSLPFQILEKETPLGLAVSPAPKKGKVYSLSGFRMGPEVLEDAPPALVHPLFAHEPDHFYKYDNDFPPAQHLVLDSVKGPLTDREHEFINGAGALKGNFFFDDGMICLGQNIRRIAPGSGKILTTLNNVIRQSDVIYSIDGSVEKTVRAGAPAEKKLAVRNTAWVWHDDVGYIVLGNAEMVLSCGEQPFHERLKKDKDFKNAISRELGSKAWKKGSFDMFRLWMDHGSDPQNQTYAYAVFPNVSVEELKAKAGQLAGTMGQNKDDIQTVLKDGIRYAVFQKPGVAHFADGKTITADVPLVVMERDGTFHAANPVHSGLRRSYVPGTEKTVGTLVEKPVQISVGGFGAAASVSFQLPVARGEEGGSVPGTAVR